MHQAPITAAKDTNTLRTNRPRDGEAHDAAHEHPVLEALQEVLAARVEREHVREEGVSHQVSVEMACKNRLRPISEGAGNNQRKEKMRTTGKKNELGGDTKTQPVWWWWV